MGAQENESRKRTHRNQLRILVLQTVQSVGVVGVAFVAPNVLGAMVKLGMLPSPRQKEVITRTSYRLVKAGLLCWENGKLKLTERGERHLRMLTLQSLAKRRPPRWDHKWRVLVFDIPERRRALRIKLRSTLQSIGFKRLQDSVWVYPYDCEDLIALLKSDFKIGDDVRYIIADSIERDAALCKFFELKK